MGHQVAVKVYQKFKLVTDMGLKQNLKREIRILTKLSKIEEREGTSCAHILKLYESIETIDKIYLVMEMLTGESLYAISKNKQREKKFTLEQAVEILR